MIAALEISGGLFVVVVLGYVLGSFLLMRSHTAARTFGVSMRSLLREIFLAAITQPFLPLYYLLGYRMEPLLGRGVALLGEDAVPVVFVHGYMQNRVGFLGLARALSRRGIGPLYGINYPWFASIASNSKRLERFVDRVCKETKRDAVDLVCHSMGGLVAMEMMRDQAERWRKREETSPGETTKATAKKNVKRTMNVRRCVTIATPHGGVAWRGPMIGIDATSLRRGSKLLVEHAGYTVEVPTLSVFSSHDNVVHPKETAYLTKRGGTDVEVEGVAHLSILFSAKVADHVARFLTEPGPSEAIVRADVSGANGEQQQQQHHNEDIPDEEPADGESALGGHRDGRG